MDGEELSSKVKGIISLLDLESCTLKSVVRELEQSTGDTIDPSQHARIAEMVDQVLMEKLLADEDEKLARELQQQELRQTRQRAIRTKIPKPKPLHGKGRKTAASGFNRPLVLSVPLTELLGGIQLLPRPTVVKELWKYVKEHQLQDPSNKKIINCDEKLEAIFKKKRIDCFQMNRYLSKHLHSQEELIQREDIDPKAIGSEDHPDLLPAKRANLSLVSLSKYDIPHSLKRIISDSSLLKGTMKEIQDACLEYVKLRQLFDPVNPTTIKVDGEIRAALGLDSEVELTLFDFVERVRLLLTSD